MRRGLDFIEYWEKNFLGVVCVSVELAVVCCCRVFPSRFSQFKIWVFTAGFFPWGKLASFP